MKERNNILLAGIMTVVGMLLFISCQEEGLVMNSNDVSYVNFGKDMTKDTTRVCFEFYALEEGMDAKVAEIPLAVSVSGKVQDKDLHFTVGVDEKLSTFPTSQCILPEDCVIKQGRLQDTIYIKLKNSPDLKENTKFLVIRINAAGEVSEGVVAKSRAVIAATDRLVKPDWWEYKDLYDGTESSVDWYYLGDYSETKYRMFLEVLRKNDDILFDGQDRAKLRKYSLELKYMVAEENEQRPTDDPLRDEMGEIIEIPVAG